MSTASQARNENVGDRVRPRTRPRSVTLCVGVPKGGPPTTSTSDRFAHGEIDQPPTSDRPRTETRCPRCGSTDFRDVPFHNG